MLCCAGGRWWLHCSRTLTLLTPFCFRKSTKLAAMKNTAAGVSVTPSSGLAVTAQQGVVVVRPGFARLVTEAWLRP